MTLSRSVALVIAIAAALNPLGADAAEAPALEVIAPQEAVFYLHIDGKALAAHADMKPIVDLLHRMAKEYNEVDAANVVELHWSAVPIAEFEPLNPMSAIRFRNRKEADRLYSSFPKYEDVEHAGKKYRRSKTQPAIYRLDDVTVVVGGELALKSYLEKPTPPAALVAAVNRPGVHGQICWAMLPGGIKKAYEEMYKFQLLTPSLPAFRLMKLAGHVSVASGGFDISSDEFLRAELETPGGESPKEVKDRIDSLLDLARDGVNDFALPQLEAAPIAADLKNLGKPLTAESLEKIKVAIDDKRVIVSLATSKELARVARVGLPHLATYFWQARIDAMKEAQRGRDD